MDYETYYKLETLFMSRDGEPFGNENKLTGGIGLLLSWIRSLKTVYWWKNKH
jgi:hypothetical protein